MSATARFRDAIHSLAGTHPIAQRVLHITGDLLPKSETFVQQRLVAGTFDPVALAWRHVPDGLEIPCPFSILPDRGPTEGSTGPASRVTSLGRRALRRSDLFRAMAHARPAIVHAHFGVVGVAVARMCSALDVPLVVSFYGFDVGTVEPGGATHRAYQRMFRTGAAFTAEGPVLARRLIALGAPPDRVKLLPLSLPPWALLPPSTDVDLDHGPLQLIQVARFTEKKGIDTTLDALGLVRARGLDVRLTLVGDGADRAAVDARIDRLGIGAAITRPGMVAHAALPGYFGRHHALVQPSRTARNGDTEGGHPTVLVEAEAQGLAVLATVHGDIPTAVGHERTGLLGPEGDARVLADNIERMARDRALLGRLRAAARPWALRRHDPAMLTRLRERIYRRAIGLPGHSR